MGKLAERLADPSRSGVYRIRTTEAIEEAAALNGYRLLRFKGEILPTELPQVIVFETASDALLATLKMHAVGARKRGECFFATLVDPEEKAALAPLYKDKKS